MSKQPTKVRKLTFKDVEFRFTTDAPALLKAIEFDLFTLTLKNPIAISLSEAFERGEIFTINGRPFKAQQCAINMMAGEHHFTIQKQKVVPWLVKKRKTNTKNKKRK